MNTLSLNKKQPAQNLSATCSAPAKSSVCGHRHLSAEITVSNDTRITGLNNNDLIIGPTGSGKTGGYVVPNLSDPHGSLVVSDTKGRLLHMYRDFLESRGYQVHVIDFVNPSRSDGYNPFQFIRRYENGSPYERDIQTLATLMMPPQDRHEPFWEMAAGRYLAALIGFVIEALPENEQTVKSLCCIHREYLNPRSGLIPEWILEHPDSYTAKRFKALKGSRDAEKMWGSIMEFANAALEPLDYKEFSSVFENPVSFDLASLGKKKTVLFLITSDNDPAFDLFTNIFHAQLLQTLIQTADRNKDGQLKVPVRIILDDFAASAKLPDFARTISIIRSRNISVSIILQSKSQLSGLYGTCDADSILNNCDHILYLGGHDLDTANFICSHIDKPLSSVLKIAKDKAILITHGESAAIVKKSRPYADLPETITGHEPDGKEIAHD